MRKTRRQRHKIPVEPIEITIQRLSHEGRGVASIDGKIAFVDGALPGETVKATFTSCRSQFDELKVEEILVPSVDRVDPPCTHADICGGCSMQHISTAAQIALKEHVLHEQMKHIAGLSDYEHLPPMLGHTEGYRRKARLAARFVSKKDEMLIGFREKNSSFIAQMGSCAVLVPDVSALITPLRQLLATFAGRLQIPQIEVAVGEREPEDMGVIESESITQYQVALIVRHLEDLVDEDKEKLLAFAEQYDIHLYMQPKGPDSVHKVWPQDNCDRLFYTLPEFGLRVAFHPSDFTQVNGDINRRMISQALTLLDLQPEDVVLDLFCGLGNFTLPIATRCARVVGVEGSDEMVRRGTENAIANSISNASFYSANLCVDFDESTWAQPAYDKILIDPPRSGAVEIIPRIAAFRARKIVYISCNPATLARDAGELVKHGYVLKQAGIMDMFPHTGHVESIAEFILAKTRH
ncbi:MAG: 23S rRNA (uracil(1939)-C(5))-methyltransferase RlmD [Gammaproteobacteria bacterium]|nr:23S rRNA (uracil(1939)-C(5))-methyltransferase RlmD [Gammaproteobacteria bacterium]MDP2140936.1 23S rRNA (uracil(1939)-C(5))-methyltransferase RlmD [Gammaproteobacteria bacterium]MDP2349320.1 23S rRNA (uracil(1939)-C(5))-methyltransferase RlmD [Gammaproteobacteria bacterium]